VGSLQLQVSKFGRREKNASKRALSALKAPLWRGGVPNGYVDTPETRIGLFYGHGSGFG
jgi:hypothetical protein